MKQPSLRIQQSNLSLLLRAVGTVIIFLGIVSIVLAVLKERNIFFLRFINKGWAKNLGSLSEYVVFSVAGLWLVRTLWVQMKKRNIPFENGAKNLFLFLRKHHTLLGWASFAVAAGHGIYFLLYPSDKVKDVYTGIAAMVGFILVAAAGWRYQAFKKGKPSHSHRKTHVWLAILFGFALTLHLLV